MSRVGEWQPGVTTSCVIACLGIVLVVLGYFGPWIPHKTVALTVTGAELYWFSKPFGFPLRALFITPMIGAAVIWGLVAQRLPARKRSRFGLTFLGVGVVLASLPVYDSILSPEYRAQLILTIVGIILVFLTLFAFLLPLRVWGTAVTLLAFLGILPAVWQFAVFYPQVVVLYKEPLGIGWGFIVCVIGSVTLLSYGLGAALAPKRFFTCPQ
jgi:hypothetical protein